MRGSTDRACPLEGCCRRHSCHLYAASAVNSNSIASYSHVAPFEKVGRPFFTVPFVLLTRHSSGSVAYFGPIGENYGEVLQYCRQSCRKRCPSDKNPAEFLLDVSRLDSSARHWHTSKQQRVFRVVCYIYPKRVLISTCLQDIDQQLSTAGPPDEIKTRYELPLVYDPLAVFETRTPPPSQCKYPNLAQS